VNIARLGLTDAWDGAIMLKEAGFHWT
jgi:hypothetical protein